MRGASRCDAKGCDRAGGQNVAPKPTSPQKHDPFTSRSHGRRVPLHRSELGIVLTGGRLVGLRLAAFHQNNEQTMNTKAGSLARACCSVAGLGRPIRPVRLVHGAGRVFNNHVVILGKRLVQTGTLRHKCACMRCEFLLSFYYAAAFDQNLIKTHSSRELVAESASLRQLWTTLYPK